MRHSEDLKRELLNRLSSVWKDADGADGEFNPAQVDALERLARVLEVAERVEEKPSPRRWPLAAAFVLTLAIVSLLLFLRVSTTEIQLNVLATEVRFDLAREQQVTAPIALTALSVAGLQALDAPRARNASGTTIPAGEKALSGLRLALESDVTEFDRLTLAAFAPPAGTRLWFFQTDTPGAFGLSARHPDLVFAANVRGRLEITGQGSIEETRDFGRVGRSFEFRTGPGPVDIVLAPAPGARTLVSGPVAATNLYLQRAHENVVGGRPVSFSTILGGDLFLTSVADRKHTLRAGETLRFDSAMGEIATLEWKNDHVALTFVGSVNGMTTGRGNARRSLMPTYLEWLQAHYSWSLLWGSALYVFGLYLSVMRWWRTGK